MCVAVAIALPLIVLAIVKGMPVKSVASDLDNNDKLPTDFYMVRTIVVTVLIFVATILLCMILFCSNFTAQLVAKKIDTQTLQLTEKTKE